LVLVDHNELSQAVAGAAHAELVEVLDHHRLGNPSTTMPIRFIADPVGSSSTLVAERGFEAGLTFPAPIAGVLLSGIFSDTLVFKSPTTTPRDQKAAEKLAQMAGLKDADAVGQYGAALLASGAGLSAYTAEQIVSNDFKQYEAAGNSAGIVQAEVAGFAELPGRLDDLTAALEKMRSAGKLSLVMLMVTDIIGSNSRLLAVGEASILAGLPYTRLADGTFDAPGMVSRKKQLLPVILDVLAKG
jgi:manganese-dependent inorganic pyrophosphatase